MVRCYHAFVVLTTPCPRYVSGEVQRQRELVSKTGKFIIYSFGGEELSCTHALMSAFAAGEHDAYVAQLIISHETQTWKKYLVNPGCKKRVFQSLH